MGINHIAFNTNDIERDTQFFLDRGCDLVFNVTTNGKTVENYIDTRLHGDLMISLRPPADTWEKSWRKNNESHPLVNKWKFLGLGICVNDLESASGYYSKLGYKTIEEKKVRKEWKITSQEFYVSNVLFELIQAEKDSIYRNSLAQRGDGVAEMIFQVSDLKTEIDRDETPEIIMMRLRYKIDRGEYKHAETVYAQKVCNVITDRGAQVPDSIKKQWHDERLKQLQTKTKLAFDKKFNIQEILMSPQYEEIHQYLRNDLQLRASIEPLLALPNDLIKEIQSKRQESSEENIVDLNLVKTQKILRQTEEETNDLDDLLPDVLNHFNPMAEAELALLDEEIARARKKKKSVKNLDAQSKESNRGHSRSNPRKD